MLGFVISAASPGMCQLASTKEEHDNRVPHNNRGSLFLFTFLEFGHYQIWFQVVFDYLTDRSKNLLLFKKDKILGR